MFHRICEEFYAFILTQILGRVSDISDLVKDIYFWFVGALLSPRCVYIVTNQVGNIYNFSVYYIFFVIFFQAIL